MKSIDGMLRIFFIGVLIFSVSEISAQTYPEPEFSNEVYYLKKENPCSLVRLEKNSAKQENKTNVLKGSEYGYEIEGKSSSVRFNNGSGISFIFSTGKSSSSSHSNSASDSTMRANGIDPNSFSGFGSADPSTINLYKLNIDGGSRKIYIMKSGGYFGSHKNQSSDKYTFSVKKIHDGYWELVIDKPLPHGEYAFTMPAMMGAQDMTGSMTVFAFGVD